MTANAFGLAVAREAARQHKSCAFKRDMVATLSRDYDLDEPFRLHTGIMVAAGLSGNVTRTEEWYAWEKYKRRAAGIRPVASDARK